MRGRRKPPPDGIHPHVAGHILDRFPRPQNMVIVALLPKDRPVGFPELKCSSLLEDIYKSDQITVFRAPFHEEVDMVGHDAIGVKQEIVQSCDCQEMTEQPASGGSVGKK